MVSPVANTRSHRPRGLSWQPSLLDGAAPGPSIDPSFAALVRDALDETAWIDACQGWVRGAATLFEVLVESAPWAQRTVPMYGRMVDEPRLVAMYGCPGVAPMPAVMSEMAEALSERYGREFDSVGAALYRDGHDSVAWHGDRIPPSIVNPVVAIVSLGSPRTLRVRPTPPRRDPPARSFPLAAGDLVVMGGSSQRTWQHSIPKVAGAGARISLQFRHSR